MMGAAKRFGDYETRKLYGEARKLSELCAWQLKRHYQRNRRISPNTVSAIAIAHAIGAGL